MSSPAVSALERTRSVAVGGCAGALAAHDRLTQGASRTGSLLLESADVGGSAGRQSFVWPDPLLRVLLRGRDLSVTALAPRAAPLLPLLARRLGEGAAVTGRELHARASQPSWDPARNDRARLRSPSAFDALREVIGLVADGGADPPVALAGAFAYELVDHFEELPARPPDPLDEPDLNLVLATDGILFDHRSGVVTATARALAGDGIDAEAEASAADARLSSYLEALAPGNAPSPAPLPPSVPSLPTFVPEEPDEQFLAGVERFLEHIAAGEIFQGVLSRSLTVTSDAPPLAVYRELRADNPSPYMFLFELGDGHLLGASPETCLRVTDGEAMLAPIAGTAPRGLRADGSVDTDLDTRLAVGLLLDAKEQAEHSMLIDLARNDLARICVPGSREVEAPLVVEPYSHVQHLVSRVRGRLDPALDALDAYRAVANMGTLTGTPKLRAMELIRESEPSARGWYGGAVGHLSARGNFDSCIVIRSLRHREGVYTARAGAGVVADSDPARELTETLHKARAPLLAIARAEARQRVAGR